LIRVNFAFGHDATQDDEGFSLIELLIVIVILGILSTVVVFSVRGVSDRGQDGACAQDARALATAVESYFAKNGGSSIPATGAGAERFEQTLVDSGLMRGTTRYWDVAAEGYLVSVTPC
jgi:prepilin-type N-terminal cleavage/methylation domain-containing protein